jgi:hypothetical protein
MKSRAGVILLEAILSVVVMSVSLAVIIHTYLVSYRGHNQGALSTMGLFALENEMTHIWWDLDNKISDLYQQEKSSDKPFEKFQVTTLAQKGAPPLDAFNILSVMVRWPEGEKIKQTEVVTMVKEMKFD